MFDNNKGRYEQWTQNASPGWFSSWPLIIGVILLSTVVGTFAVLLMLHLVWPSMMLSLVVLVGVRIALVGLRMNFARRYWSRNRW